MQRRSDVLMSKREMLPRRHQRVRSCSRDEALRQVRDGAADTLVPLRSTRHGDCADECSTETCAHIYVLGREDEREREREMKMATFQVRPSTKDGSGLGIGILR